MAATERSTAWTRALDVVVQLLASLGSHWCQSVTAGTSIFISGSGSPADLGFAQSSAVEQWETGDGTGDGARSRVTPHPERSEGSSLPA